MSRLVFSALRMLKLQGEGRDWQPARSSSLCHSEPEQRKGGLRWLEKSDPSNKYIYIYIYIFFAWLVKNKGDPQKSKKGGLILVGRSEGGKFPIFSSSQPGWPARARRDKPRAKIWFVPGTCSLKWSESVQDTPQSKKNISKQFTWNLTERPCKLKQFPFKGSPLSGLWEMEPTSVIQPKGPED